MWIYKLNALWIKKLNKCNYICKCNVVIVMHIQCSTSMLWHQCCISEKVSNASMLIPAVVTIHKTIFTNRFCDWRPWRSKLGTVTVTVIFFKRLNTTQLSTVFYFHIKWVSVLLYFCLFISSLSITGSAPPASSPPDTSGVVVRIHVVHNQW